MPPKLSILLKLNLLGGLSARQIAEKLELPQKVVSRNLTKAKEIFREMIQRGGKPDGTTTEEVDFLWKKRTYRFLQQKIGGVVNRRRTVRNQLVSNRRFIDS